MTRRNEYRVYLQSEDWKKLRELALIRTNGLCQFCGDYATQVHHVKYPKQFGAEHPHSLVPVCDKCHKISHGVQKMKQLEHAVVMTELSPSGINLNYLLSGGRVYASAKSWTRSLQVPDCMKVWFEQRLISTAMFKKESSGESLEMEYQNTAVYRWHVVGELLRTFDREWYQSQYKSREKTEQQAIEKFHNNYERLINWGYDLQERALSSMLNGDNQKNSVVTQENLVDAMKQAVAPRLRAHDDKLYEHDVVIAEIKQSMPTKRDQEEFITVKQAIAEQGLDASAMPLHPKSRDTLSGLAGKKLKAMNAEQGASVMARLDGQKIDIPTNSYRRGVIYEILQELSDGGQSKLL